MLRDDNLLMSAGFVAHLKDVRDIHREGPSVGGVEALPVKAGIQLTDDEAFAAQVLLQLAVQDGVGNHLLQHLHHQHTFNCYHRCEGNLKSLSGPL